MANLISVWQMILLRWAEPFALWVSLVSLRSLLCVWLFFDRFKVLIFCVQGGVSFIPFSPYLHFSFFLLCSIPKWQTRIFVQKGGQIMQ